MSEPWYREGLEFTCTQCGDCCTGKPGYVWVTRKEVEALASFLKLSSDEFRRRYVRQVGRRYSLVEKSNSDCIFYDKGCTVYPARPVQCRTFPFWSENLKSRSAWTEASGECPGVGKGKLYSLEAIGRIRKGQGSASVG